MKKLFIILTVLLSSCTTTRYIYVVDDLYYSRPLERQPIVRKPYYGRPPLMSPLPLHGMYWQYRRSRPQQQGTGPRVYNLETYRSEHQPPPPPTNKKEETREGVRKEAPVRKLF